MLRLSCISLSLWFVALAVPCAAQDAPYEVESESAVRARAPEPSFTITRTPEMWFYEQERIRYEDPKMAVRRRAEQKGAQRANRIAAMKWYGKSNSRPLVFTTPSMGGGYAPTWDSNTYQPMRWRPYFTPEVVMRPIEARY